MSIDYCLNGFPLVYVRCKTSELIIIRVDYPKCLKDHSKKPLTMLPVRDPEHSPTQRVHIRHRIGALLTSAFACVA